MVSTCSFVRKYTWRMSLRPHDKYKYPSTSTSKSTETPSASTSTSTANLYSSTTRIQVQVPSTSTCLLSRVHGRYRRQTDGRRHMTYSERELPMTRGILTRTSHKRMIIYVCISCLHIAYEEQISVAEPEPE